MLFSNSRFDNCEGIESRIISLFSFHNNETNHFLSIYETGKIREFLTEPLVDIGDYYMERPDNKFLSSNGHIPSYENPKISRVHVYKNMFFIGYQDGLILVWLQSIENNPNNEIIPEEEANIIDDLNSKYQKKYFNTYDLEFIFIGHTEKILELFYLESKNFLFSSCDNCSVRIWDLNKGVTIYAFNFDSHIYRFLTIADKKNQIVTFFSRDYHKFNLNIGKEPFIFSTNTFKLNTEKEFIFYNNKYYIIGMHADIHILDANLTGLKQVNDYNSTKFNFVKNYKDFFVTVTDDNHLKINEINEEKKEIMNLIKYNLGKNEIDYMNILNEKFCLIITRDKKIHLLNLQNELSLYDERKKMREEEKLSVQFNIQLRAKSGKKKPASGKKPGTASSKGTEREKSAKKISSSVDPKASKNLKGDKADSAKLKDPKKAGKSKK